jgi:enamine deaminase RidA (YjgF/YER057c/UK114 family)
MVGAKGSLPEGADRRLQELGIQLPAAPTPFGPYVETVQTGNLLFFSGMLPVVDHKPKYVGRLGKELDVEAGRDAAYTAALGVLAAAKDHLGSLDRVTRVVRLGVFIATSGTSSTSPESRMLSPTCFEISLASRRCRFGWSSVLPASRWGCRLNSMSSLKSQNRQSR